MKFDALLRLLLAASLAALQPVRAQQPERPSADDAKAAAAQRAYEQRQYEESDDGVHARHAAEAPIREAQRHWRATHHPWKILVFHAFRPGILSLCENVHQWPDFERLALPDPADPSRGRWLTESASVGWSGGRFAKGGDAPQAGKLLTDACFVLYVDDVPALSGAVVSSFSARRFAFPALVVDGPTGAAGASATALRMTLAPGFPADPSLPASPQWREVLGKISGAD
jgi:hypothetical protein